MVGRAGGDGSSVVPSDQEYSTLVICFSTRPSESSAEDAAAAADGEQDSLARSSVAVSQ